MSPEGQRFESIRRRAASREDDHGGPVDPAAASELPQDLESAGSRHRQVEDARVVVVSPQHAECLDSVGRLREPQAGEAEVYAQDRSDVGVVVDDEHLRSLVTVHRYQLS